MSKQEEMEELENKYRHNGFKVPENYFEDLEDKVFQRLSDSQKKHVPVMKVTKKPTQWLVAASMAVLCTIGYMAYKGSTPPKTSLTFDNIDETELMEFENEVELSEEEFEEIIPAYTIDSLYHAEIIPAGNIEYDTEELEDLEDEFSPLDDSVDI